MRQCHIFEHTIEEVTQHVEERCHANKRQVDSEGSATVLKILSTKHRAVTVPLRTTGRDRVSQQQIISYTDIPCLIAVYCSRANAESHYRLGCIYRHVR